MTVRGFDELKAFEIIRLHHKVLVLVHASGTVTSRRKYIFIVWRQIMEIHRPDHQSGSMKHSWNNRKCSTCLSQMNQLESCCELCKSNFFHIMDHYDTFCIFLSSRFLFVAQRCWRFFSFIGGSTVTFFTTLCHCICISWCMVAGWEVDPSLVFVSFIDLRRASLQLFTWYWWILTGNDISINLIGKCQIA